MHNYNPSCALKPQGCFGKFTSCMTFGAHKLVHSEPFLDYVYKIWHLLSALYSDVHKKNLYRCTSSFSALYYCGGIFLKSLLSISWQIVCQSVQGFRTFDFTGGQRGNWRRRYNSAALPRSLWLSGVHKLFRRFLDFSQFLTAIYRKLWRHLAMEIRTV